MLKELKAIVGKLFEKGLKVEDGLSKEIHVCPPVDNVGSGMGEFIRAVTDYENEMACSDDR